MAAAAAVPQSQPLLPLTSTVGTIHALPEELLILIFSDTVFRLRDYVNYSLVCKQWNWLIHNAGISQRWNQILSACYLIPNHPYHVRTGSMDFVKQMQAADCHIYIDISSSMQDPLLGVNQDLVNKVEAITKRCFALFQTIKIYGFADNVSHPYILLKDHAIKDIFDRMVKLLKSPGTSFHFLLDILNPYQQEEEDAQLPTKVVYVMSDLVLSGGKEIQLSIDAIKKVKSQSRIRLSFIEIPNPDKPNTRFKYLLKKYLERGNLPFVNLIDDCHPIPPPPEKKQRTSL